MLRKLLTAYKTNAGKAHLHWVSHYRRVTGKPAPSGYSFSLYDSISHLPRDRWDDANTGNDIFLSTAYLEALEQAPPENMRFRYAMIRQEDIPVGIAYFQILELDYRLHVAPEKKSIANKRNDFLRKVHDRIIKTAGTRLLVCGNAMISGEHGFCISIPQDRAFHVLAEIAYTIRKSSNPRITATLFKDYYKKRDIPTNILENFGYHRFDAGPNMCVPLRKGWDTFDTYLDAMKAKYRKRASSAIKKCARIERRSLTLDEIVRNKGELFSLYCQVVNKAKFKIFFLSPDYFIELKRRLGDRFVCVGYFLNSKMLGFTTRILNSALLEGYTHGMAYDRNKEFELYQNFLLDDVREAIAAGSTCINTGRTSIAMKSSVGAVPEEMVCYLRFSGSHSNQIVTPILRFLKPSNEYCRNPFEK
jgi:hypothetical protein